MFLKKTASCFSDHLAKILIIFSLFCLSLPAWAQPADQNFDSEGMIDPMVNVTSLNVGDWTFTAGSAVRMVVTTSAEAGNVLNVDEGATDRSIGINVTSLSETTFGFESTSGGDFDLVSFDLGSSGGATSVTITGVRDGGTFSTTGEVVDLTVSDAVGQIMYAKGANNGGTLTLGSDFDNIDEIQLVFSGPVNLAIDNIDAEPAVAGDMTAPLLSSSTPSDNDVDVATADNLVLTFDENIAFGTGNIVLRLSSDNSAVFTIDASNPAATSDVASISTTMLTIDPNAALLEETGYYLEIASTAIEDASGNAFLGISGATTLNFTTADETAPLLSSSTPSDNDVDVATADNLVLTFDENIAFGTGNIVLRLSSDNSAVFTIDASNPAITSDVASISTTMLTIDPNAALLEETGYYLEIASTAIEDASGNAFLGISGATTLNFTTADETAPLLSSSTPSDNDTGVLVGSNLVLTFNENIAFGTGNIVLRLSSDNSAVFTIDASNPAATSDVASISTTMLTIDPNAALLEETGYYLEIASMAIEDASGNAFLGISGSSTLNFTTEDNTAPSVLSITRDTPTDENTNADALTFLVTFSEDVVNVATDDFLIFGTGAGFSVNPVTASTYDIDISGGDLANLNAEVRIDITASPTIQDNAGNALPTGEPATDETFTVDNTPPTVSNLNIFDTNDDGLIDRIDITFSENVALAAAAGAADLADLGTLTLPDGQTATAATFTDPGGTTNVVSVTGIAGQMTQNTANGSTGIDGLENIWEDAAGNLMTALGDDSETRTDSAAPVLISSTPTDESPTFGLSDNVVLNFSETIIAGTGNIMLDDTGDNSDDQTYSVGDPEVGISGATLTLNPPADLEDNETYQVLLDVGAVEDAGNIDFAGLIAGDLNFTAGTLAPPACGFSHTLTASNELHVFDSNCNSVSGSVSSVNNETEAVFFFNLTNGSDLVEQFDGITISNTNGGLDWSTIIASATLVDEDDAFAQTTNITSNSIIFSGIPFASNSDLGYLEGDGSDVLDAEDKPFGVEYALFLTFEGNLTSLDGLTLDFAIINAGNFNFPGASTFGAGSASGSATVEVTATDYAFLSTAQPTNTEANDIMSTVQLEAVDSNGNRDTGYNVSDAVQITSTGTLSGTPSVSTNWASGIGTVSDIIHTATGTNLTLGTNLGALNNAPASDMFNITTDMMAPTLSSVSIASDNANTSQAMVGDQVTITFTANEGLQTPSATIAGQTAMISDLSDGNDATWSASYTLLVSDTEGAIGFSISFSDIIGIAGTAVTATTDASSVTFDRMVPTIAINTPIEVDDIVNASEDADVTISGTTSGAQDGQTVTVEFDDGVNPVVQVTGTVTSNAWTASDADISGLDEGTITVTADVSDLAGNAATQATENVTLDQTATIAITTPIEVDDIVNAAEDADVTISGTTTGVEDGQTVTVEFDDGVNPVVQVTGTVTSNAWTASDANISGLDDGTITVTADVSDVAGNAATQASENITLDQCSFQPLPSRHP